MKLVLAILRPEQLPAIKVALYDAQIEQFVVSTALGTIPRAEQRVYRGVEQRISLKPRIRIELAVHNSQLDAALEALRLGAQETGGHGIVFVTELHDAMLLGSGERGPRAI